MSRFVFLVLIASQSTAIADGAFCELTPCVPGPVTRRKLTADQPAAGLTCKKGQEIGVDSQNRIVFCTTAKAATIDGIPVAADAYTLFHSNGKIYQTHARLAFDRTIADGSKVSCGADLFALNDDGTLRYCKLAAKRTGSPAARVGAGISFHPNGRLAAITLDDPYPITGVTFPAGTAVNWDDKGKLIGGWAREGIAAWGLTIRFDFLVHPNGKPKYVELAKPANLFGHAFPDFAKLKFRDDSSLEAAEYISERGFMIHGEEWTDTTTMTFDRAGKVLSSHTVHWQSDVRPPKFR